MVYAKLEEKMENLEDKTSEKIRTFREEASKDRRAADKRFDHYLAEAAEERRMMEKRTDAYMQRMDQKQEEHQHKTAEYMREALERADKQMDRQRRTIRWAAGMILTAIIASTSYTKCTQQHIKKDIPTRITIEYKVTQDHKKN